MNFDIIINNQIVKVKLEKESFIYNLGKPSFEPKKIPVLIDKNIFFNEKINNYLVSSLYLLEPHTILFLEDINLDKLYEIGSKIIYDYHFPNSTNFDLVKVIDKNNIEMLMLSKENKEVESSIIAAGVSCIVGVLDNKLNQNEEINIYQNKDILKVIYNLDDQIIVKKQLLNKQNAKKIKKFQKKC